MAELFRRIVLGAASLLLAFPVWATDSQEEVYARRALDAVAKDLRDNGLAPESFQLELIGRPVLYPAHAHLHSPQGSPLSEPARFSGKVLDPTGAGIPSVTLTLLDPANSVLAQAVTGRGGSFEITPANPGTYWLRVETPGFKSMEILLQTFAPAPNPLRVVLEVGPSSHTVRASAHLLAGTHDHGLPEAIVAVAVYGPASYVERTYSVTFRLNEPDAQHLYAPPELRLTFPPAELRRVNEELAAFLEVGLDISRGPERFYPFLPQDMHSYGGWGSDNVAWMLPREVAAQLSDDELRRLVSLALDLGAHVAWFSLEGDLPDDWLEDFSEDTSDPDWPRKAAASFSKATARIKERLQKQGALNPEHTKAVAPYLRKLLGEGLVAKRWNGDHLPDVPRWTELYAGPACGAVYFVREGGKLRLATFVIAD